MRLILKNTAVFIALAIALSAATSCTSSKPTGEVASNDAANGSAPANTGEARPASVYPPLASGMRSAEFELLDGTKSNVDGMKGKVVLLNIWGIWCGPCRQEMPQLIAFQQQYKDKGFEIVGLNIGDKNGGPESVDAIKKFSDQMGLNYTLARLDPAGVRQFYTVTKEEVVPQSMLIDRDGHLRGVFIGGGGRVLNSMQEVIEKTIAE